MLPSLFGGWRDWVLVALVFILAWAAFLNGVKGDWVYDDRLQILSNWMLYEPGNAWKAITSDVWAYRSRNLPGMQGGSYWRPIFTAQLLIQYQLFGFEQRELWHVANYLLHAIVCGLALVLLRRLKIAPLAAFAGACVFAVHPAHVESVTWISGSPDLLLGIGVFGAAICATALARRNSWWLWVILTCSYLFAVGSKEVGLFTPLVAAAVAFACRREVRSEEPVLSSLARAFHVLFPGLVVVLLFLTARDGIAQVARRVDDAPTKLEIVLSAPQIAVFYVKQCFWPWESLFSPLAPPGLSQPVAGGVGPGHPMRPVTQENMAWWNFWVPLVIAGMMGLVMLWSVWRRRAGFIGLTMFVLMLGPAMYIRMFPPDHTVRDRYLYLPLLGMILMVYALVGLAPGVCAWWRGGRREGESSRARSGGGAPAAAVAGVVETASASSAASQARSWHWSAVVIPVVLLLVCIPMTIKTVRYNRIWASEALLWEAAVRADPTSSHALVEVAMMREREGKVEEALRYYDLALQQDVRVMGLLGRARMLMRLQRYADAEPDVIKAVLATRGKPEDSDVLACYRLASRVMERQNKLDGALGAIGFLREARLRFPNAQLSLTDDIARLLITNKQLDEARAELERVMPLITNDTSRDAALLHFRLGIVHSESPRIAEAASHFRRFMEITADKSGDTVIEKLRVDVARWLAQLPPGTGGTPGASGGAGGGSSGAGGAGGPGGSGGSGVTP